VQQRPAGAEINLARGEPGKLTVWGDYLNSDTRTAVAILKMLEIEYKFSLVDTLKEENKQEAYLAQSYCDTIPMISNNQFKVIGGDITALKFIKNFFPQVKKELYPEDQEKDVDRFLGWF
jgi:glutathione S-transferase